ncbi:MAG TPA: hypothetical protein PK987_09720 [Ferruginibacter sp.]|nr:hypothetical protein [Ferruginibacter sp.]
MIAILTNAAGIIIAATATAIGAAITRAIEKRQLRKQGKLKD